jgi:hypothetical protein
LRDRPVLSIGFLARVCAVACADFLHTVIGRIAFKAELLTARNLVGDVSRRRSNFRRWHRYARNSRSFPGRKAPTCTSLPRSRSTFYRMQRSLRTKTHRLLLPESAKGQPGTPRVRSHCRPAPTVSCSEQIRTQRCSILESIDCSFRGPSHWSNSRRRPPRTYQLGRSTLAGTARGRVAPHRHGADLKEYQGDNPGSSGITPARR